MSIDFSNFARVSRALPQTANEGDQAEMRASRYGEQSVIALLRKQHALVGEGSYFVCNGGGQTGILASPATGWVATTPALVVYNTDRPSNPAARSIFLDYVNLVTTVVGSAASGLVNLQAALYLDTGNRYVSGGTEITANIVNPSMYFPVRNSVMRAWFGAITAAAAVAPRPVCPLRVIRPAVSGTVLDVVGETKWFNFGGVEGCLNGSITIANANFITVPMPAVEVAPDTCALLYLWQNVGGTNVAATYAPEIGEWER
jgi:hypothetical protein